MSVSLPPIAVSIELTDAINVPSTSSKEPTESPKSEMSLSFPETAVSKELTDACRSEVTEPPATDSKELTEETKLLMSVS